MKRKRLIASADRLDLLAKRMRLLAISDKRKHSDAKLYIQEALQEELDHWC